MPRKDHDREINAIAYLHLQLSKSVLSNDATYQLNKVQNKGLCQKALADRITLTGKPPSQQLMSRGEESRRTKQATFLLE